MMDFFSQDFFWLQQRFGISLLNRQPVGLVSKFQNAVVNPYKKQCFPKKKTKPQNKSELISANNQ